MSDIYVFSSNEESNDYSTMGLVGALTPTKCTFKEEANGESTITLSHPLDEFGRYVALQRGNILVVPVPVRTTPEIENGHCVTTVWEYKVKPKNQLTAKSQRTLYKKKTGSGKKKVLNYETIVAVVSMSDDENERVKVRTKSNTTGWMYRTGLQLITKHEGLPDNSQAIEEILSPWTVSDQYFRIYETTSKLDSIEVSARHISYDLLYNMTDYESKDEATLETVVNGILNNCYTTHDFEAHTNVDNKRAGSTYKGNNPIDAIMNLEKGVCTRFDVSLVRDNYDLYFLKDPGLNRGVQIRYSKNMTGIDFKSSEDEVATRIVPVGEKKNGDPLYLSNTISERYIDSPYISAYPYPHVYQLKCERCKIKDKDSDGGKVTEAIAKARMRQQAQDLLTEKKVDEPKIEMKVEFLNLGDTEEYAQFKNLENLFLFDYVIVQHPSLYYKDKDGTVKPLNVTARVVGIEWDCLLDRMNSIEIGQVGKTLANTGITSWQIPNGFSGSKIEAGTIDTSALASEAIAAKHIQAETINAEHLNATEIAAFVITAVSAHLEDLVAGRIETSELYAAFADIANLTAQHINSEDISTDELAAALANITVLSAGTGYFDRNTVTHLVASALNLQYGSGQDVFIQNLRVNYAQMVSAAIGNLCIKASDGNYYAIDVAQNGNVTATLTAVTASEIAAGQTSGGRTILDTDIVATNLSTSNLLGTYALVNQIDASRIDVDQLFAREAFVSRLNTSVIESEDFLEVLVGTVDNGIESMRFGVRNYLRNSRDLVWEDHYDFNYDPQEVQVEPSSEAVNAIIYNGEQDKVLRISNSIDIPYLLTPVALIENVPAIFSIWARAESSVVLNINAFGKTGEYLIGNGWQRIIIKIDEPSGNTISITPSSNDIFYLCRGLVQSNANVPSDWIAAPEDTDSMIVESYELASNAKAWFRFEEDGFITRKQGSKWSTSVAEDGFYIDHEDVADHVGAFHKELLEVHGIQIGEIVCRKTDNGGWVWTNV